MIFCGAKLFAKTILGEKKHFHSFTMLLLQSSRRLLHASRRRVCSAAGQQQEKPPLGLTSRAANRILQLNAAREKGAKPRALRLSVEPGGCSGFQYNFELTDGGAAETTDSGAAPAKPAATADASSDVTISEGGATLVVDVDSLELVRGSTVDFEDELMRSAFVVSDNPLAANACGCGSSFDVKD